MEYSEYFSSEHIKDKELLSDLGLLLIHHKKLILENWASKVQEEVHQAQQMMLPILINTMPSYIDNLAQALSPQYPRLTANSFNNLAPEHGAERARLSNYSHYELIKEYQILRRIIFGTLKDLQIEMTEKEAMIIIASIDEAIQISAASFTLAHNKMREQFAATLTHDLKNPLTAIALASDILSLKSLDPLVLRQSQKITQYCKRMEKMINDLLNQTMITFHGRLELNLGKYEIQLMLSEIMDELSENVRNRFHISGEVIEGYWDESHLRRAIENLVGNAVKYSTAESTITMHAKSWSDNLILTIHSSGQVIPPDEKEDIFQVFRRAHDPTARPGWGLGLPLVRSVAEAHGGSIVVDSSEAGGTTFTLNLPLDARPFQEHPTLE